MIVGIHQPNFFPYTGFLAKLRACDRFVLLTHCQYERGNYLNRFDLHGRWYTMPVNQSLEPLKNKQYPDYIKNWTTIRRRLPDTYKPVFDFFNHCVSESLVETNVAVIRRLCDRLGISTEIVMDYPTTLHATARLVDLCRYYGATTYLSGSSGPNYLEMNAFKQAGLIVEIQERKAELNRAALDYLITMDEYQCYPVVGL